MNAFTMPDDGEREAFILTTNGLLIGLDLNFDGSIFTPIQIW